MAATGLSPTLTEQVAWKVQLGPSGSLHLLPHGWLFHTSFPLSDCDLFHSRVFLFIVFSSGYQHRAQCRTGVRMYLLNECLKRPI